MKTDRHSKILELIKDNSISTQEELALALNNAGYNVTNEYKKNRLSPLPSQRLLLNQVNVYLTYYIYHSMASTTSPCFNEACTSIIR